MIYLLHEDPVECAKLLADKDLDKQIKAIAQTLVNVHWTLDSCWHCDKGYDYEECTCLPLNDLRGKPLPPKLTKKMEWGDFTHWVSECRANYDYLVKAGLEACYEYSFRFSHPDKDLFEMDMMGELATHKMLPVIKWADQNRPELNGNYELKPVKIDNITLGYRNESTPTPFPLTVPKEHIIYDCEIYEPTALICIIESYRNYYRAKIKKLSNCECLDCKGMLPRHDPQWTRREKPEWL